MEFKNRFFCHLKCLKHKDNHNQCEDAALIDGFSTSFCLTSSPALEALMEVMLYIDLK